MTKCPNPKCNGDLKDNYEDNNTVHVYYCNSCHYENRVSLKPNYVDIDAKDGDNQRKSHFI